VARVDFRDLASSVEGDDAEWSPPRHAWRSFWHSRHRDSSEARPFFDHAGDILRRHVTLDPIAFNFSVMAAREVRADIMGVPCRVDHVPTDHFVVNREAILSKVRDPHLAAASCWCPHHVDRQAFARSGFVREPRSTSDGDCCDCQDGN
ncbi:uncharacterized protein METZ01_LOCUS49651, partial [marine metagenome]